jgi:sugar transferase (PEP-CTERM/EpsH1 system associated)
MSTGDLRRLKIGHVVHQLGIGGLERIVVTLMEGVDQREFTSSVYGIAGGGELMREMESKGFEVRVLAKGAGLAPLIPFRLASLFKKDHVDVVHCHNFGAFAYGAVAGRMAGVRGIVYTAHGPVFPSRPRQAFFQRLPLADRVVTVSEFLRRGAVEETGLDPSRVITIRNGIDYSRYAKKDPSISTAKRVEIGAKERDVVIGVVARLSPEKDHHTLIEAFARVVGGRPESRLVVVGDGELMPSLRERCAALGIERSVIFLGSRTDVPDLLATFDVFAISSREEGLGITILEAMAAGVPVIATSVGGIPEIIEHGVAGITVPPGDPSVFADAIEWVLSHKAAAEEMAAKARDRIRDGFGIDRMIEAYEDLYRSRSTDE